MRRLSLAPLAFLGVAGITAAWWALALWPVAEAPAWLARTRAVCFGSSGNGLPDAAGWTALAVQPAVMFGAVVAIWGRDLARVGRALKATGPGRVGLAAVGLTLLAGIGLTGWRVGTAATPSSAGLPAPPIASHSLIDRPAPPLDGLVDQHGDPVRLADFRGRSLFVAFAFGHCETVCPLVVKGALDARRDLGGEPALLVVTLDPWRDTPRRLPYLARRWKLGPDARVASGEAETVEAILDAWSVPRDRDPRTGDLVHPPLVYVVDSAGTIAYAASGEGGVLARLARELERS